MSEPASALLNRLTGSAVSLVYRLAAYFSLTILDDPAMLALAFC